MMASMLIVRHQHPYVPQHRKGLRKNMKLFESCHTEICISNYINLNMAWPELTELSAGARTW